MWSNHVSFLTFSGFTKEMVKFNKLEYKNRVNLDKNYFNLVQILKYHDKVKH